MLFSDIITDTLIPKWEIIENIPEFAILKETQQSTVWHAEGNAFIHTKLVTLAAINIVKQHIKDYDYAKLLILAALTHDLGKGTTTYFDKKDNDWHCKSHGSASEKIIRKLFAEEDFWLREKVCYMAKHHMVLHHIFDDREKTLRKFIKLSYGLVEVYMMNYLNLADNLGSKSKDKTIASAYEHYNDIEKFAENYHINVFKYTFQNQEEKHKFFNEKVKNNDGSAHESDDFTVYMMVGIPGSGKNYWIDNNLSQDVVRISRDDIRTEIGIPGEKPMGNKEQEKQVTEIVNERIKQCCENRQSFVINNTNLRKQYRDAFKEIALAYNPRIVYVYCEAPTLNDSLKRREGTIPQNVINRMWNDMEFPLPWEYDKLLLNVQRNNQ